MHRLQESGTSSGVARVFEFDNQAIVSSVASSTVFVVSPFNLDSFRASK